MVIPSMTKSSYWKTWVIDCKTNDTSNAGVLIFSIYLLCKIHSLTIKIFYLYISDNDFSKIRFLKLIEN